MASVGNPANEANRESSMTDPSRDVGRAPSSDLPSLPRAGRPSRGSLAGNDVVVVGCHVGPWVAGNDGAGDGQAAPAGQKSWFSRTRDRLRGRKVPRWTGKGAAAGLVTTGVGGGIATAVAVAAGKGAAIGGAAGLGFFGVGALGGALIGGAIGAVVAIVVGGGIGYLAAGGWAGRDAAEQTIDRLRGKGLITAQEAQTLRSLSSAELGGLCKLSDRELGIGDRAERQRMCSAIREHLVLKAARDGVPAANTLKAALLDGDDDLGRVRRGYEVIDPNARAQILDPNRIAPTLRDWDVRVRGDESLRLIAPLLSQDDQRTITGLSRDARLRSALQRVDQEVPVQHRMQARAAILLQAARGGPQAAAGLLDQLMQEHKVGLSWNKKVKVEAEEKEPHQREVGEKPWTEKVKRMTGTVAMHGYESLDTWWARQRAGGQGQEIDPDGAWQAIHQGHAPDFQTPSYRVVEKALLSGKGGSAPLRGVLVHVMDRLGPMDEARRFACMSELLDELTDPQVEWLLGRLAGEGLSDRQLVDMLRSTLGTGFDRLSPEVRAVLPVPPARQVAGQTDQALIQVAAIPLDGVGLDVAQRLKSLPGWKEQRPKMMRFVQSAEHDLAPLQDAARRLAGSEPRPLSHEDAKIVDDRSESPADERRARRVTFIGEEGGVRFAPGPIDPATQIRALRLSCLMMQFAVACNQQALGGSVEAAVAATLAAAEGHGRSLPELEKTLQELNRKAKPPKNLLRPSIRSAWEKDGASLEEERPAGTVRVAPDGHRGVLKRRAPLPPPPPSEDDSNPIERAQAESADDEKG
jgi:hypothetical protein